MCGKSLNVKGEFNFLVTPMTQLKLDNAQFSYVSFEVTIEHIPTFDRLIPTMRVVEADEVEAKR